MPVWNAEPARRTVLPRQYRYAQVWVAPTRCLSRNGSRSGHPSVSLPQLPRNQLGTQPAAEVNVPASRAEINTPVVTHQKRTLRVISRLSMPRCLYRHYRNRRTSLTNRSPSSFRRWNSKTRSFRCSALGVGRIELPYRSFNERIRTTALSM